MPLLHIYSYKVRSAFVSPDNVRTHTHIPDRSLYPATKAVGVTDTPINKSVFSLLRQLSTWHCPHLMPSAVLRRHCCQRACSWYAVPAPAAVYRYLPPAGRSAANPPTPPLLLSIAVTDGRTDRRTHATRTLDRYRHPALHMTRAVPINMSIVFRMNIVFNQ